MGLKFLDDTGLAHFWERIKSIYGSSISISDHTITLKNKNGDSLGTVTVPDNNTTYTFATGDSNGQIKVTPSGGSAQNVSVKGLAALAYKASLSKSDVGLGNVDNTSDASKQIYEANLLWGGKNFAASYGPIDAAMVGELGANRLMFIKASSITIEYTRDGGTTWVDYGATDSQKASLFSSGQGFTIGKADSTNKATANGTNYQLRVTVDTGLAPVYTTLNKFVFYVGTNGSTNSTVTIQKALQSTPTTFVNHVEDIPISGWSGYNVINVSGITTYGNTASSQYGRLRFLFKANGGNTDYVGLSVGKIMGFGGVGWTTPSTMAKTGHLYSFDALQNATFPSQITATQFNGVATKLSGVSGSVNADRHVWFSDSTTETARNYDDAFTYNPNTDTLKVANLTGNATSSTKATGDESGNNIKATYAASISISDHTITLKNKNGDSLGTVTVPDNNTTYTVASPITLTDTEIGHATSGVTAASKGDTSNQTPGFGSTFKVPSGTVNATGHLTAFADHTVKIPDATATSSKAGLMSSTDKSAFDTMNGGGSVGQVWKMTAANTAGWSSDNDTTYTFATGDSNGQIKITPSGGSAQNVDVKGLGALAYKATVPIATSSVVGGIKSGGDVTVNSSTGAVTVNGFIPTSAKGAASGVAELGSDGKVPSSQLPPGNADTTYTIASGDANGQIKVTPSTGTAYNVNVTGLGSLAYISSLSASDVGAVPTSRTVNSKALSSDISLTASDVGAVDKTGDTMTGDLTLYAASGNSPGLIFKRGTFTDSLNDWEIKNKSGNLYFGQRGSGSSDFDSTIYFGYSGGIVAAQMYANNFLRAGTESTTTDYTDVSGRYIYVHGRTGSGYLVVETSSTADTYCSAKNTNHWIQLLSSTNAGVWSQTKSKWLISINSSGTVTANTSDERYKNILGSMPDSEALDILRGVEVINFTYKEDENALVQNGIIAQQLRDVLKAKGIGSRPYLIVEAAGESSEMGYDLDKPEEDIIYSIDYSKFTPLLWKGWQMHDEKIAKLEVENAELKARLDRLEAFISKNL